MADNHTPRLLVAAQTELGECPVWDDARACFFCMDITEKKVLRLDWRTKALTSVPMPALGGGLVLASDGRLLACLQTGVYWLDPDTGEFTFIVDPEPHKPDHRLNEAKADPQGRLWVGSISTLGRFPTSALYRVNKDTSIDVVISNISVPNTMVWLPSGEEMLFADSPRKVIWRYRYDPDSGALFDQRIFADCSDYEGMPDGAAVDAEGGVWVADFGGGMIRRYDQHGLISDRVELPASQVTSCAFAGAALDELVIITTKRLLSDAQRKTQVHAGDLFVVSPDVPGLPPHVITA